MNDKNFYFLFFIDVSGSMLGKQISCVNAALSECINVFHQTEADSYSKARIGIYSFSEKVFTVIGLQPIHHISSPQLRVASDNDGFYSLSSFTALFKGMKKLFESIPFRSEIDNAYIFLVSDGKSTDFKDDALIQSVQQFPIYQKALKYFALAGDDVHQISEDAAAFTEGAESDVIGLEQLPDVVAKLQVVLGNS